MLAKLKRCASERSVSTLLLYGIGVRLIALLYSIIHDHYVDHIKYTDIDYEVFTDGARSIVAGRSPYENPEYRYTPLVALVFTPNIVLGKITGKLILIIADVLNGDLQYRLNIYQGTNRSNSKLLLLLWLINPFTIAISTRGSFEPIMTLLVLASVYLLVTNNSLLAGIIYGLSIHVKLYPIIYALTFYIYLIQKKPYIKTQTKLYHWIKTLTPGSNQFKLFISAGLSLAVSSYFSYKYYGQTYLDQSIIYHMNRKDTQHNFSIYFYFFRSFPKSQDLLSLAAFVQQIIGVLALSIYYLSFDTNRRTKLKKLCFSLFATTMLFVSLNKVCTSQYFNWYLIFLPLIIDSVKIGMKQACSIASIWLSSQAIWLLSAYLYEYWHYNIVQLVACSSALFLISNIYILKVLCVNFDASRQPRDEIKE